MSSQMMASDVLGLDALGQLRLGAGHRLAELAALGLEVLGADEAPRIGLGRGLLGEGPGERFLAFEHELVQRASLLLGEAVR